MRKKIKNGFLNGIIAIMAAVLMLSLLYLGSLYLNYHTSNVEYDRIVAEMTISDNPQGESDDFEVDWNYLHSVNPDIVAWIRFPNLDISYPVVKGETNDQYLHTTVEGTSAYAGSIFLDSANSIDFSDDNTFIYGHNMRNLSMFGSLKNLYRDEAVLRENEYFWIYTEDFTYKYSIFALGNAKIADRNFTFINGSEEEKQAYINYCIGANMFEMPVTADVDDYIVTLSTCTSTSSDTYRFQVHAIRTEATPKK